MLAVVVVLLVTLPLLYFLCEYIHHIYLLSRYPTGPFPLPVIGNLHLLGDGSESHKILRQLARIHGDVFGISFGMNRIVVVNAIEPAREALVTKGLDFVGRPQGYMTGLLSRDFKDVVFADYGPLWTYQRKLGHQSLTMYSERSGVRMEDSITMEGDELMERLRNANGEPVDVYLEFGCAVINIICTVLFGTRYKPSDGEFKQVVKACALMCEGLSNGDPVSFLPWLRFFPPLLPAGLKKLKQGIAMKDPIVRRMLVEHRATFDGDHIRDFTDSLIATSGEGRGWKNVGLEEFSDDHLEMILSDMFIGGAETTTTALRWLVLYLLHWPHIQQQVYEEIINTIGTQRYPEIKDRANLPLCQATIQETLRLSTVTPLGLPHKATRDSSIGGLGIPKGTQILFNYWHIHHDPREWKDPETFDPHRWLNENGEYVPGKHKSSLPFSAGRRNCIGESLAKKELFLISTHFIRDFKVEATVKDDLPSLQAKVGVTLSPQPFTALFLPRN